MRSGRTAVGKGTSRINRAGRGPALEALEPRTLLSATTPTCDSALYAVNVATAGTYEVDVYESASYGTSGRVTNLTLGAVDTAVPVTVHSASTPAVTVTGRTLVASWDVTLGAGQALLRVPTSYYTPTVSAAQMASTAPSHLTLTAQSAYAIGLTWTNNAGTGVQFRVEREVAGSNLWTVLTPTALPTASFTDATVAPGTTYTYRVYATGAMGNSDYSPALTVTTAAGVPGNLAVTVQSAYTISLSWTNNAGSGRSSSCSGRPRGRTCGRR